MAAAPCGSLCATPVWQSMHVALPEANFLCCLTASSDCLALSMACGSWQCRQFAELSARISSHTMLARRQRSWSNFSWVEIVPRISAIGVGDALFRLDDQLGRVAVRDVAVDAHRAHAGPVVVVRGQLMLGIDELLVRVAGRAAELVGARDGHGDLRADDHHGADQEPDHEQREHRPARRWREQPAPRPPERARGLRGRHAATWTRERPRRPPSGRRRSRRPSCGPPCRRS